MRLLLNEKDLKRSTYLGFTRTFSTIGFHDFKPSVQRAIRAMGSATFIPGKDIARRIADGMRIDPRMKRHTEMKRKS